jgi:hypothetical protein
MAKSRMDLSTEGVRVLAQALMETEVSVEESAAGRGWGSLEHPNHRLTVASSCYRPRLNDRFGSSALDYLAAARAGLQARHGRCAPKRDAVPHAHLVGLFAHGVAQQERRIAGALRVILVRDRRAEQRVHKWIRRNREEGRAGLEAISGESRSGDPSEHRDADCDRSADQLYDSLDRYGWMPCRCATASRCLRS